MVLSYGVFFIEVSSPSTRVNVHVCVCVQNIRAAFVAEEAVILMC
jgi:hypothetical protein